MRTLAAAGLLSTFTVLTVVLLKNQIEEIPKRDIATSLLLMGSSLASVFPVLWEGRQRIPHDKANRRPDSFLRVSSQLMHLEVLFTLILPWFLLKSSRFLQHTLRFLPETDHAIDHLLVPHLYFFHAQIVGETILFVSHKDSLVFPYTCLANAFRAFPLGTWIQRSLLTAKSIQPYNPLHWLLVAGLPLVASLLWLYSSLIFIPLKWYPVVQHDVQEGKHPGKE